MNWLDVILLIILAGSVIGSFRKGLSRQVIRLAAVVLGIFLGAYYYGKLAVYLRPHVNTQLAADLGGFLIVFCAVLLLGGMVSWIVGKFLRVTGLTIVDHLLGAAFGLLRGVLVAVALLMGVMAFSKDDTPPRAVVESRIAPYISQASRVFAAMAPQELKDGFRRTYAQAKEAWAQSSKDRHRTAAEAERK